MTEQDAATLITNEVVNAIHAAEHHLERDLTDNERESVVNDLLGSLTDNASVNQPRHPTKGHFMPNGSGTGHGATHDAANIGHKNGSLIENDPDDDEDEDEDEDEDPTDNTGDDEEPIDNEFFPFNCGGSMNDLHDTMSDHHDVSKQAVNASIDHGPAREHALNAIDASKGGKHSEAAGHHIKAAKVHEAAATNARKQGKRNAADGHDQAASLHRKAASMHASVQNARVSSDDEDDEDDEDDSEVENEGPRPQLKSPARMRPIKPRLKRPSVTGNEATGDPQHDAMMASVREAGATKSTSKEAHVATRQANYGDHATKSHEKAAHKKASKANMDAAAAHTEAGDHKLAKEFKKTAAAHDKKAKSLTGNIKWKKKVDTMNRYDKLSILTQNCRCEDDRAALNKLSDDTLSLLLYNATSARKESHIKEEDDSETEEDGSEVENDWSSGTKADIFDSGPASGSAFPSGFNPSMMGDSRGKKKKATMNQLLQHATIEDRDTWNEAQQVLREKKLAIVRHLVGNMADARERQEFGRELMRKSIPELKKLARMIPTQNGYVAPKEAEPSFLGNGDIPVFNDGGGVDGDDAGLLPIPRMSDED